jgi:hypothetical protein
MPQFYLMDLQFETVNLRDMMRIIVVNKITDYIKSLLYQKPRNPNFYYKIDFQNDQYCFEL